MIIHSTESSDIIGKNARPFVKWAGGKRQLLNYIGRLVTEAVCRNGMDTYVEPFVGGGSVLMWTLANIPSIKKAVVNDINKNLVTAYSVVKENPYGLISSLSEIDREYRSRDIDGMEEFYYSARDRYNNGGLTPVENAAAFVFLNRTCYNGLYRVNKKGRFNTPFGKYRNPNICDRENIMACSKLLANVDILCGDFADTLRYAGPNVFFYIDPPYKPLTKTSGFTSYSEASFNDDDQLRLREYCGKISEAGSLFAMSNSDVRQNDPTNAFFDEMYEGFRINRVSASRMINSVGEKRGKVSELLICNY